MSTTQAVASAPLTRLQVPYADTTARQLRYSLHAAPVPGLARHDHHADGITVSLRLLGASHQVLVTDERADDPVLCETVACLPDLDTRLPASFAEDGYVFTARVDTYAAPEFADIVGAVLDRADAHTTAGLPAVAGAFPGDPLAVTAILGEVLDSSITWQTWHTYPQTGEIVITRSELPCAAARVTGSWPTR